MAELPPEEEEPPPEAEPEPEPEQVPEGVPKEQITRWTRSHGRWNPLLLRGWRWVDRRLATTPAPALDTPGLWLRIVGFYEEMDSFAKVELRSESVYRIEVVSPDPQTGAHPAVIAASAPLSCRSLLQGCPTACTSTAATASLTPSASDSPPTSARWRWRRCRSTPRNASH